MTATETHLLPDNPSFALGALAACYFTLAVGSLSVVGLALPMGEGLGATTSEIALLVTFFSVTYAVSAPLAQVVVGHWDRRLLLVIGLLSIAAGTAVTALAQGYPTAAFGRVLMAMGGGLTGPMASAAAAALVPAAQRGPALGKVFGGLTIATVVGVPMTTWLGDVLGWRGALWAVTTFAAANALAVVALVPRHARGDRAALGDILAILGDRVLLPALSVTAWQMAAQFTTYSVIAFFLIDRFGLPSTWLPLALAGFGIGGILGNILSTVLITRLGPNRLIWGSLTASALVLLALQLAGGQLWVGLGLGFLWPVFALALFAPQQERLLKLNPKGANLMLALNASTIYIGMALGGAIAGLLVRLSGSDWLALASALLMLGGLVSFQVSRRRRT
ncbi:MAG: MFS transporter [Pseudomonadota bacterium]